MLRDTNKLYKYTEGEDVGESKNSESENVGEKKISTGHGWRA